MLYAWLCRLSKIRVQDKNKAENTTPITAMPDIARVSAPLSEEGLALAEEELEEGPG